MRFRQSRFTDFTHHWIDCIKPFGQVFCCSWQNGRANATLSQC
jgi:hypothetical protein